MIARLGRGKIWISWGLIFSFVLFMQVSGASLRRSETVKNEEVSSGKITDSPGIFEEEGSPEGKAKKKKSVLPWIIGAVVVAAAGSIFIKLVSKVDQFKLSVFVEPGIHGEPEAGVHEYERGTRVDYSYTSSSLLRVQFGTTMLRQKGSLYVWDHNQVLTVATTNVADERFFLEDALSIHWQPRTPGEWRISNRIYVCRSSASGWNYNLFNFAWPSTAYMVSSSMTRERLDGSFGLLLATTNNMRNVSGYYVAVKNYDSTAPTKPNFSIWKLEGVDLETGQGSFTAIRDWTYTDGAKVFTQVASDYTGPVLKVVRQGSRYDVFADPSEWLVQNRLLDSFTDSSFDPRYCALMFEGNLTPTTMRYYWFHIE